MKKENIYYALSVFAAVTTVSTAVMFDTAEVQIILEIILAVLCGAFFYLGISQTMLRQSQKETQRRDLLEHYCEELGTKISDIVSLQTSSLLDICTSLNAQINSKLDTIINTEENRSKQAEDFRTELFSKLLSVNGENQKMGMALEKTVKELSASCIEQISISTQQQTSKVQEQSEAVQTVLHQIKEQIQNEAKSLDTIINAEADRNEQTEKFRTELFSKLLSVNEESQKMGKALEETIKRLSKSCIEQISISTQQQTGKIQEQSDAIQTIIHEIKGQLQNEAKNNDDFYGLISSQLKLLHKNNEETANYLPSIQSDLRTIFEIIKTSMNKNERLLSEINDIIQDLEPIFNTELVQAIERQAESYRAITETYENITAQDARLIERIFGDK